MQRHWRMARRKLVDRRLLIGKTGSERHPPRLCPACRMETCFGLVPAPVLRKKDWEPKSAAVARPRVERRYSEPIWHLQVRLPRLCLPMQRSECWNCSDYRCYRRLRVSPAQLIGSTASEGFRQQKGLWEPTRYPSHSAFRLVL